MIFNNSDAALRAAADGLGLVHLPVYVERDAIASGLLVPLLEKYCMPIGSLWIIWPASRTLSLKFRAFADFILERFAARPEAFMPFRDGYGKIGFAETPSP